MLGESLTKSQVTGFVEPTPRLGTKPSIEVEKQ